MPATSWALVDAPRGDDATLADALVAAVRAGHGTELGTLLDRWGAFVRAASAEVAYAATADNVTITSGSGLRVTRPLRTGVDAGAIDDAARAARACHHLAVTLVERAAVDDATMTVDALAARLGSQAGLAFDPGAPARARAHEAAARAAVEGGDAAAIHDALEAQGTWTVLDALAAGTVSGDDARAALASALGALAEARAERDAAQAATIELAAARALARSLGEELERDEWIRARLRNVKRTPPARLLIAARKRALGRA